MNTRNSLSFGGTLSTSSMARHPDLFWSDGVHNSPLSSSSGHLAAPGDFNPITRFSLNSPSTLHSIIDSDATSSSISSCSATNNSSNSLSVSPAIERNHSPRSWSKQNSPHQQRTTVSKHLLELQREIKEEEDEIFADLNSLINGRSYSDSLESHDHDIQRRDTITADSQNEHQPLNNNSSTSLDRTSILELVSPQNHNSDYFRQLTSNSTRPYYVNNDNFSSAFHLTADITSSEGMDSEDSVDLGLKSKVNHQNFKFTPTNNKPIEHVPSDFSSGSYKDAHRSIVNGKPNQQDADRITEIDSGDDEENKYDDQYHPLGEHNSDAHFADEQEQANGQQEYDQAIQSVIQQVTNNLPKPCVFFLEGNCRRSDCKYSHDLSNITCKYWIEGFCFKGEMCPFSHSFMPQNDNQFSPDDEMLESLRKKQLDPTFVIESEADFPSLPLDSPTTGPGDKQRSKLNSLSITTSIKNQILSSNPAVVFKTVKKKRKKG